MKIITDFINRVAFISKSAQKKAELNQWQKELEQQQTELKLKAIKYNTLLDGFQKTTYNSVDNTPWNHPYLTTNNIKRFREYSEAVWQFALDYEKKQSKPLNIAFSVNMAQSMYKWTCLTPKYGAKATLFLNPMDDTALSCPEWEEFEGEHHDVFDGKEFLETNTHIKPETPCHNIPMEDSGLYSAYQEFCAGNRKPLLHLLNNSLGLRHEVLLSYQGFYPYFKWAKALSKFDVIYIASAPYAAYASGKPYCAFSVGGDFQFDCGRSDDLGKAMLLSFNAARFIMMSNPHQLGHARRLGLTNGVYLPYPMDSNRYCPGEAQTRHIWETHYGKGIYVLTSARLDKAVKGHSEDFYLELKNVAMQRPQLRFIFLGWGNSASEFKAKIEADGIQKQFIILPPVGKTKLIDYYRSCDIVLDQFVYGYYGATALEAASIGKPVIIKLRKEHYSPLYQGDIMPAFSATNPTEMGKALLELCDNENLRSQKSTEMRNWLVRTHGEEKTMPLLLALLRLTANGVPLPKELVNPLWDEETKVEQAYHQSCLQKNS